MTYKVFIQKNAGGIWYTTHFHNATDAMDYAADQCRGGATVVEVYKKSRGGYINYCTFKRNEQ